MQFTDDLIASIAADPLTGLIDLIGVVQDELSRSDQREWTSQERQLVSETMVVIQELHEAGILSIELDFPYFGDVDDKTASSMAKLLNDIKSKCEAKLVENRLVALRDRVKNVVKSGFQYEFSQGDLDRVQKLVNELRGLISESDRLENGHKQRLLRRLEKLQSELHKKTSDLDRFWGLIGDAGVVLGKLGTDAKPIVDRLTEIARIVWQTQSRAEELPSGTDLPVLEDRRDE